MPNRPKFISIALVASCSLLAPLAIFYPDTTSAGTTVDQDNQSTAAQDTSRLPLKDLRAFTEVLQRIKNDYVEPIDDKTLLENAIRGMLENLDPHSAYLQKEDFQNIEENTSGEFGGLGIEVSGKDGLIRVITPIDGTPAHKAGIKAGDLIVKLDDTPVRTLGLKKSVSLMRGKPGEPITLTVTRDGLGQPLDITIVRDIIKIDSVRHRIIDSGFGYLRISQFQVDTAKEVTKALREMRKKGTLNGLILDLRNNPGGVFQSAIAVADLFLDSGLIVYTKGRIANANMKYSATKKDPSQGIPLVVMINAGSASASEIVAGALQDHRRGIIIGTKSFGKGSVQTVHELHSDSERGLKLTTARYYTPSGRSIQAEGITPDVNIADANVTRIQEEISYREADLSNHLEENTRAPSISPRTRADTSAQLEATDYQLYQAVNILKSLHLSRRQSAPAN